MCMLLRQHRGGVASGCRIVVGWIPALAGNAVRRVNAEKEFLASLVICFTLSKAPFADRELTCHPSSRTSFDGKTESATLSHRRFPVFSSSHDGIWIPTSARSPSNASARGRFESIQQNASSTRFVFPSKKGGIHLLPGYPHRFSGSILDHNQL